ncbi:MAG: MMPL family transporter [Phycisphaerae bacterium]|nr:MAG: MMPL family transporter [Phycisphaerae bacterium]MBE7457905.1 MMPL family transporter [Planctomycetia bacterium]MCK6465508.1 efflux RND transporter permease subunit [Phycisphaerae bacterium]MCL4720097.1 MMPL family transporter [Phycisphaerae bacterium]NUQ10402.1 MMPL family transporter [Phycisphaerae bacterium]
MSERYAVAGPRRRSPASRASVCAELRGRRDPEFARAEAAQLGYARRQARSTLDLVQRWKSAVERILFRRPGRAAIVVAALTATGVVLTLKPGLRRDYRLEAFIASQDEHYLTFRSTLEEFTSNELALVAVRTDDALSPKSLAIVADLVERLENVPSVQQVGAWTQIPGWLRRLAAERLLRHPLVEGNLLSRDRRTATIVLQMSGEGGSGAASDPVRNGEHRREVVGRLKSIVEDARRDHPEAEFILAGPYVTLIDMYAAVDRDLVRFSAAAFALLGATLVLILRGFLPLAVTVGAGLAALACTLGLAAALGLNTSLVVQMLVILIVVLTVGNGVQLAVDYEACLSEAERAGSGVEERSTAALRRMLRRMTMPCAAAMITTMAGFGSVCVSRLTPVRTFGALMALGMGLGLVFSLVLAGLLERRKVERPDSSLDGWVRRLLIAAADCSIAHPRGLILFFVVTVVIFGAGIARLRFESDFVRNFRPDSEVRRSYEFIERNLTPLGAVDVVIRRDDGGCMMTVDALRRARAFAEDAVAVHPNVIRKAMTPADLLDVVPGAPPALDAGLTFRAAGASLLLGPDALRNFFNADRTAMRINLRAIEGVSVGEKLRVIDDLQKRANAAFGEGHSVVVTGLYPFYATLVAELVRDQYASFALAGAAILAVLTMWLRSLRLALICLIPNAVPVLLCVGTMGWTGVPVNMTTVMMLSVVFGISVDSTVHYVWRFRELAAESGDREEAIRRTSGSVGRACLFTGIVVIGGFSILTLSSFLPTAHFGGLIGYTMMWALIADLTLLPLLLMRAERAVPPG